MHLDNVRLLVTRFEETFAFYRDALGLSLTWGDATAAFASFEAKGGSGIGLFRRDLMAQAVGTSTLPPSAKAQDAVALIFAVDDVDAEVARLEPLGVAIASRPRDMADWGIRVAHVRDPDGNLLELFQPIAKEQWSERLKEEDRALKKT
jgi:catechol 2,3-dioxygenase-like lactoylglutathione lyase family enzyme